MKTFKRFRWLGILIVLVLLGGLGFVVWAQATPEPLPEAIRALQSDPEVTVEQDGWLVFRPAGTVPTVGLVFYPGGRIDPRSYAPAGHALAGEGYLVVIPNMPLNLAVFAPNKAQEVIAAFPDLQNWVVGGHSLGGAMATAFAYKHPQLVDGLVLWAAYPAGNNSLAGSDLPVVSISGSLDGLSTPEKIQASHALLPVETRFVEIQGGNHAQFGWYGVQAGDNLARISREEQQRQVIVATREFLEGIP